MIFYTPEAQEVFKAIEDLRDYVIERPDLRETLVGKLFIDEPCTNDKLINLTNKIIEKVIMLRRKIISEFNLSNVDLDRDDYFIVDRAISIKGCPPRYYCPFRYLEVYGWMMWDGFQDLVAKEEVISQNLNLISHDLLILESLFNKINTVRFYTIKAKINS